MFFSLYRFSSVKYAKGNGFPFGKVLCLPLYAEFAKSRQDHKTFSNCNAAIKIWSDIPHCTALELHNLWDFLDIFMSFLFHALYFNFWIYSCDIGQILNKCYTGRNISMRFWQCWGKKGASVTWIRNENLLTKLITILK